MWREHVVLYIWNTLYKSSPLPRPSIFGWTLRSQTQKVNKILILILRRLLVIFGWDLVWLCRLSWRLHWKLRWRLRIPPVVEAPDCVYKPWDWRAAWSTNSRSCVESCYLSYAWSCSLQEACVVFARRLQIWSSLWRPINPKFNLIFCGLLLLY